MSQDAVFRTHPTSVSMWIWNILTLIKICSDPSIYNLFGAIAPVYPHSTLVYIWFPQFFSQFPDGKNNISSQKKTKIKQYYVFLLHKFNSYIYIHQFNFIICSFCYMTWVRYFASISPNDHRNNVRNCTCFVFDQIQIHWYISNDSRMRYELRAISVI